MDKPKNLALAIGLFVLGVLVGASGLYFWFVKNTPQQVANLVLANLIPGQSKELHLLMQVTEGIEGRPLKDSKMALCRLIDIKFSIMDAAAQTLTATPTWPAAHRLNEYAIASIPLAEEIEQSTKCEKEWLPNIAVKWDAPQAARPLP